MRVATILLMLWAVTAPSQQFRALRLSGKVTLPDGSPPPEETIVELNCPSGQYPQAHTNRKGEFLFSVGGMQARTLMDSSQSRPGDQIGASGPDRSHVSMTGCTMRAYLAGYTSSTIDLGRRSVFESSEVGVIILKPATKSDGALVSVNTLAAPKKAANSFARARKELARERPDAKKAAQHLEMAVKEYPEFTEAWNLLAEARIRMDDLDGARAALDKAIASEPNFVPPYVTLALMELRGGRMAEAAQFADRAVELQRNLPEANYYRALAHSNLGNSATAEASIRIVQSSAEADRYPRTHFLLGNILLEKGDVPAAAAEFRQYIEGEPDSRAAAAVREQLGKWEAEGLVGK